MKKLDFLLALAVVTNDGTETTTFQTTSAVGALVGVARTMRVAQLRTRLPLGLGVAIAGRTTELDERSTGTSMSRKLRMLH